MSGRIFSGIQPTGALHLGNYLGAIRHWVRLQQDFEAIYCVVDQHAITLPQDPKELNGAIREVAAALIACGIDPARSILFNQSTVPAHSQLAWVLMCQTRIGWLDRMTQFKEKAGKQRENASAGLYAYPVLMAADILVYQATHVPVGEDQKQHLELARDAAGAFNHQFGSDFFTPPEPMILGEATRVMSLRDGTKKMSKSDSSDYSRINLTDDVETLAQKIRKAKSDAIEGMSYDVAKRPEASNLLTIYAALADLPRQKVLDEFASANFSKFKNRLADLCVEKLSPITSEMRRLLSDPGEIDRILNDGAKRANAIAAPVIRQVYDLIGFRQV